MKLKTNKLALTLFSTFLLLFNACQKDDDNLFYQEKKSEAKITFKTFEELIKEQKFNQSFTAVFKQNNNLITKTAIENQYGFTIANKPAKVVVTDSITSYTMLILRENQDPNYFENLVIQTNRKNQTKAAIFKYVPRQIEKHTAHGSFSFSGRVSISSLNLLQNDTTAKAIDENVTNSCTNVTFVMCHYGGSDHMAGPNCTQTFAVYLTFCQDDADGTSSGGDYGVPFDSGVGSSSGGYYGGYNGADSPVNSPSESEEPIITTPVEPSLNDGDSANASLQYLQSSLWLTKTQSMFLISHPDITNAIYQYQISNPLAYMPETIEFLKQLIDYCRENTSVTLKQIQNWFLIRKNVEGNDGDYDSSLDDITTVFPQQNLPSFNNFFLAYPSHLDSQFDTSEKMYTAVGGDVKIKFNNGARNTCALRVSRALNYSGIIIPNRPGVTVKGADGKYYFLVAANLLSWMKKTFGTPTGSNYLTGAQGGLDGINFPSLVSGKKGIYFMIPNDTSLNGFAATGHADVLENQQCDSGGSSCYFAATGGVKEIYIWELP